MRKLLALGILAVFTLFLPSRSQAVAIDVPYQISVNTTTTTSQLVLSTTAFPSANPTINGNVANGQWCLEHICVSPQGGGISNFTMFWSTSSVGIGTTDYIVVTSTGIPYCEQWAYHQPYCSPVGATSLTLKDSVAGSTITVEGYFFKGWNP